MLLLPLAGVDWGANKNVHEFVYTSNAFLAWKASEKVRVDEMHYQRAAEVDRLNQMVEEQQHLIREFKRAVKEKDDVIATLSDRLEKMYLHCQNVDHPPTGALLPHRMESLD